MFRLIVAMLSLFVVNPAFSADLTLQEIVDRHTQAVGGKEAIERVQSVEISLNIIEPKFEVDAIYRADRKVRMRIDVYAAGKRVFTEAFDGQKAWQMGEDGKKKDVSAKGTAALRNGVLYPGKLFALHEAGSVGHKLELSDREDVEGVNYYVLKLTTAEGKVSRLYINPENWLIERTRVKSALHPDIDPTEKWSETRFSDFRKTDGLLRSYKSVEIDLESGTVMQTVNVKAIRINPAIDESQFYREDEKAP